MELLCQETVQHLHARGHICQVLTSRYGVEGHPLPEEQISRSLYLQANVNYYRPLEFFLQRPWREWSNQRVLRRILDAFKPDVIFIWGMWNLSRRVAYWAEQWMPGRVVYVIADYWPMEPDADEAYWRRPVRRLWVWALMSPVRHVALHMLARQRKAYPLAMEQVACVSDYVRHKLIEAGALPSGARVIYNGIDPRPFIEAAHVPAPYQRGMRLVYVGGILPNKGVHTAVEALGLLKQRGQGSGLHLTIVGGGHPDYEQQIKLRVNELGLGEQIVFWGRVPHAEIPSILANNETFLFTSVYEEPIARTVMEAMAAGLAVIGTAVGGQQEMLNDGVNALVFAPGDETRLAESILQLQHNPALRARLVESGLKTVLEHFTLDRMVNEMEAWLETIIA